VTKGRSGGEQPQLGFGTRAVHGATVPSVEQVPASVPIYQTATWGHEDSAEYADILHFERHGYSYGRGYGNPTIEALEALVASLEGTEAAFGCSSGMAAIFSVCTALAGAGDRIVASRELYGGTWSLFNSALPRYGIAVDFVDPHDLAAVRAALRGAAGFYVETIANPLCTVAPLGELLALCHEVGVPSIVDNTFASPWLCRPAELGADFVVHSATKYLSGHSDVVAGIVCCSASDRVRVRKVVIDVGGALQPFDAWLCIRGIATLELRLERQCSSAMVLATELSGRRGVLAVHYPGLPAHPQHAVALSLLRPGHFGGMFSVELDGGVEGAARWCEALRVAWIGASLGGTHTLVTHPASTTHRQVSADDRRAIGLADGLVRVSVGLETLGDLLADFVRALSVVVAE
jgi:cystathionine beta-lyase/cystathionine gamma-synthase